MRHSNKESGYTFLMVVFLVATMLILATAVVPSVLTQGRREREAEAVWRGEQYQRAIGLYFRKFGKYPTRVEDLTKQTNGVRFLRQAYTDPLNKDDGTWRFIYVGPNGQLVGSLRHSSLLQSLVSSPTLPGAGLLSSSGLNAAPLSPTSAQPGGAGQPGTGLQAAGAAGMAGAGAAAGNSGFSSGANSTNPLEAQPQAIGGTVLGGNIIGVGSKVKENSIRVYQGGETYEEWEFIWNPATQVAIPGQQVPGGPPPPGTATQPGGPANQGLPTGQPGPGQPGNLPTNAPPPPVQPPPAN